MIDSVFSYSDDHNGIGDDVPLISPTHALISRKEPNPFTIIATMVSIAVLIVLSILVLILIIQWTKKSQPLWSMTSTRISTFSYPTTPSSATENMCNLKLPSLPGYFLDKQGHEIFIGNESKTEFGQLKSPSGMFLDTKNNVVYILDSGNNRILKYSLFNSSDATAVVEHLTSPTAFTLETNNIANLYILIYSITNDIYQVLFVSLNLPNVKHHIIINGTNTKSFSIALDIRLNIYISEWNNHRVVKWLAPTYEKSIVVAGNGSSGSEANQLSYPQGIYVDGSGDLFVADTKNNRIQNWPYGSTDGIKLGELIENPVYITFDCLHKLYIVGKTNDRVVVYRTITKNEWYGRIILSTHQDEYLMGERNETDMDNFYDFKAVSINSRNGDLYVLSAKRNRVDRFMIVGECTSIRLRTCSFSPWPRRLNFNSDE